MTKQNKMHKFVRKCEQARKKYLKQYSKFGLKYEHHTRKWWTAWHKRWKSEHPNGIEDAITYDKEENC